MLEKLRKKSYVVNRAAWRAKDTWLRVKFRSEFNQFQQLSKKFPKRFDLNWNDRAPFLYDKTKNTQFDRHYVYHTGWAARVLRDLKVAELVDIGSALYFISIVSAFLKVKFYDYRPAKLELDNVESGFADLLKLNFADNSMQTLSCMHVVEHIGLGRYGDPLDPEGDKKSMAELARVLAPGGYLLFVVPVGKPKIYYNCDRVYSRQLVEASFPSLKLLEFSLIVEDERDGGIIKNPSAALVSRQTFGCGCFLFTKV